MTRPQLPRLSDEEREALESGYVRIPIAPRADFTARCLGRQKPIDAPTLTEAWEIAIEWAEDLELPMQFADLVVTDADNPHVTVRGEITAGKL